MEIEGVTKKRRRVNCKPRNVCGWKKTVSDRDMNIWEKKNPRSRIKVVQGKFGKFYNVYADRESKTHKGRILQKNLVETKKESLQIAKRFRRRYGKKC